MTRPTPRARSLFLLVVAVAAAAVGCVGQGQRRDRPTVYFDWGPEGAVPQHVRGSFSETYRANVALLQVKLQDVAILRAVRASNLQTRGIAFSEIQDRDTLWQSPDATDEWVAGLMDAACSRSLLQFQREHPELVEIFVTNDKGMNVCQTNRTTDYYQADEEWWTETFNSAKPSHGQPEFDESSNTLAVAIYMPVIDPENGATIGATKAVMRRGKAPSS